MADTNFLDFNLEPSKGLKLKEKKTPQRYDQECRQLKLFRLEGVVAAKGVAIHTGMLDSA